MLRFVLPAFVGAAMVACTPVSPGDAARAEDECRFEARDQGFGKVSATSGPIGVGDDVDFTITASRHGNEYAGTCIYDKNTRRAQVDLQRAEDDGDNDGFAYARQVCGEEADLRGYRVRGTSDERLRNHVVRMNMELRRDGDDYVGYCRFEDGHAELDTEPG